MPVMPHNMRAVSNEQVTTAMLDQFQTKPTAQRVAATSQDP